MPPSIYLGTDGGATTSKVGGVRHDGTVVSTKLLQRPTNSAHGPEAMVAGWIGTATEYLTENGLTWDDVAGNNPPARSSTIGTPCSRLRNLPRRGPPGVQ